MDSIKAPPQKITTASHAKIGAVPSEDRFSVDIEKTASSEAHLLNRTVQNFLWKGITVTVNDRATKQPLRILDDVCGVVEAGLFRHFPLKDFPVTDTI
jgi:hypothetical protein